MKVLVTGATGNIGRMVVDQLRPSGVSIRALSKNPAKASLPPDVEVFEGYLGEIESVRPALEGIDRMYLAPVPETVEDVVAMAHDAGVQHIVDLSGEEESWWWPVAHAVERSGVAWTHLCPGEFMENCLVWADQIRRTRRVRDAYANAASALIAMQDVAAVAATALLREGQEGRTYVLTGPESLTRAEQVRSIGEAIGIDIPFIELSHEEAVEELSNVMGEFADWYLSGKAELVDQPHLANRTVEVVTGRPAMTLLEWAKQNAHQFLSK